MPNRRTPPRNQRGSSRKLAVRPTKTMLHSIVAQRLKVPFDPPQTPGSLQLQSTVSFKLSDIAITTPTITAHDVFSVINLTMGFIANRIQVNWIKVWGPEPSDIIGEIPSGVGIEEDFSKIREYDYGTKVRRPSAGLLTSRAVHDTLYHTDDTTVLWSLTDGSGNPLKRADDFHLYLVHVNYTGIFARSN